MLSLITPAEAAMPECARSRMGASLAGAWAAAPCVRAVETAGGASAAAGLAVTRPRPRPQAGPGQPAFGNATHVLGQADSVRLQRTSQKYAQTTRIAAAGGGAVGPHPARDPV